MREGLEECDGADRGLVEPCIAWGFEGGTASCRPDCTLDLGACKTCGDDATTGGEPCDGSDLKGASCESLGFDGGVLRCEACALDTSGCHECGDGVRAEAETCEGEDLGPNSCTGLGFESGTVSCTEECELDTSLCVPFNPYALSFDGLNDVVDCGNMSLGLPWTTHTWEVWIKAPSVPLGTVIQKSGCSASGNPSFRVLFNDDPVVSTLWEQICGEPCSVFCDGWGHGLSLSWPTSWFHVAFSTDPPTAVVMYDAMPLATFGGNGSVPASSWPVLIGRDSCPGGKCSAFNGAIDEIRLWSYARTPADIAADMYMQLSGSEPGLIAYWPFEEGSGTVTEEVVTGTLCTLGSSAGTDVPAWSSDTPF